LFSSGSTCLKPRANRSNRSKRNWWIEAGFNPFRVDEIFLAFSQGSSQARNPGLSDGNPFRIDRACRTTLDWLPLANSNLSRQPKLSKLQSPRSGAAELARLFLVDFGPIRDVGYSQVGLCTFELRGPVYKTEGLLNNYQPHWPKAFTKLSNAKVGPGSRRAEQPAGSGGQRGADL
jgi:hypothetical protein